MRNIAKADKVLFEGFPKIQLFSLILTSQEPQLHSLILLRSLKNLPPIG